MEKLFPSALLLVIGVVSVSRITGLRETEFVLHESRVLGKFNPVEIKIQYSKKVLQEKQEVAIRVFKAAQMPLVFS